MNYSSMKKIIMTELEKPEEKRCIIEVANPIHFHQDVINKSTLNS